MSQGNRARQVFAHQLDMIHSVDIREFVIKVFETFCTEHWWHRACSLTGKYHPLLAQNIGNNNGFTGDVGGLVRHVKYGVYWASELCRSMLGNGRSAYSDTDQRFFDIIVAALILHDLMKDGDPELAREPARLGRAGQKLIGGCHGVDLANAIWNRMLSRQGNPEQILILYGIAGHMGVWTTPPEYQPACFENEQARFVAHMVAMSDYCASRQSDIYVISEMSQMGLISQEQWTKIHALQSDRAA